MALTVRELIVRATVVPKPGEHRADAEPGRRDKARLAEEIADQVLEILRRRGER